MWRGFRRIFNASASIDILSRGTHVLITNVFWFHFIGRFRAACVIVWVWHYRVLSVLLVYSASFLPRFNCLAVFNFIPIFIIHYLQTSITPLLSLLLSKGVSYQLCQFYVVCVDFFCYFFLGTNTKLFFFSVCVIL